MIVRFKTFSDHTKFYCGRKKAKKVSIRLDLTKKRLTLLNIARDKIKDREGVDFAFADINCNLEIFLFSCATPLIRQGRSFVYDKCR